MMKFPHLFVLLFALCLLVLSRTLMVQSDGGMKYSIVFDAEVLATSFNSLTAGALEEGLILPQEVPDDVSLVRNDSLLIRVSTDSSPLAEDRKGAASDSKSANKTKSVTKNIQPDGKTKVNPKAPDGKTKGAPKAPGGKTKGAPKAKTKKKKAKKTKKGGRVKQASGQKTRSSNHQKTYSNGTKIIPPARLKQIARVDEQLTASTDRVRHHLLMTKEKDPDDPFPCPADLSYTINGTRVSKCRKHLGVGLVVDVVSIGTKHRLHYLQGQSSTWASHPSVRNFVAVTEEDDVDPFCEYNMTADILRAHNKFCRRKHNRFNPFVDRYLPMTFLVTKANPFGWLCAQARPGTALGKIARYYSTLAPSQLPDYLMLVDDDTMVRMDYFVEEMTKYNSSIARAWAGCMQAKAVGNKAYRFSPFGGAGTYFSRGSIQRLLTPLHCNRASSLNDEYTNFLCRQIVNRNKYLNLTFKEDGLTLAEHAYNTFNAWPNCYVSDWLVAHYISYFNLSTTWTNVDNSSHLHPYLRSFMEMDGLEKFKRFSGFQNRGRGCECNDGCDDVALPVCHYVGPDKMRDFTSQWLEA